MDPNREFLRHTLATVAYRAAAALAGAPDDFGDFAGAGRKPKEILAHMGDLFDWALSIAEGDQRWHNATPLDWESEQQRFFAALAAFDNYLDSGQPLHDASIERLFQGPIADALTHVGQLAMMRRLAGSPVRGENFYVAAIASGQLDREQPEPVQPFR
jgi:hypothetical protein